MTLAQSIIKLVESGSLHRIQDVVALLWLYKDLPGIKRLFRAYKIQPPRTKGVFYPPDELRDMVRAYVDHTDMPDNERTFLAELCIVLDRLYNDISIPKSHAVDPRLTEVGPVLAKVLRNNQGMITDHETFTTTVGNDTVNMTFRLDLHYHKDALLLYTGVIDTVAGTSLYFCVVINPAYVQDTISELCDDQVVPQILFFGDSETDAYNKAAKHTFR